MLEALALGGLVEALREMAKALLRGSLGQREARTLHPSFQRMVGQPGNPSQELPDTSLLRLVMQKGGLRPLSTCWGSRPRQAHLIRERWPCDAQGRSLRPGRLDGSLLDPGGAGVCLRGWAWLGVAGLQHGFLSEPLPPSRDVSSKHWPMSWKQVRTGQKTLLCKQIVESLGSGETGGA